MQINQKKLIKFCNEHDIVVTAYCPLGHPIAAEKRPDFLFDEAILGEIARKYNKTIAQVALRYLVCIDIVSQLQITMTELSLSLFIGFQIEIGTVPIPKSVNKQRIEENINIFDFNLTEDEIKYIDTLNTNERADPFTESSTHKYFPFDGTDWLQVVTKGK